MPSQINPYREWLGIESQSPNYYQLLGIANFEANPEAIWAAAYQRRALLRAQQYGDHPELAKQLLDDVDAAEACLLNPGRKTDYDRALRSGQPLPAAKRPSDSSASAGGASASAPRPRSERRLKPGGSEPKSSAVEKPADRVAQVPPPRDPQATPEPQGPQRPKAAWGYDSDAPFRAEVGPAGRSQPSPTPAPLGPGDFLPPPASPASFIPPAAVSPPASPPMAGIPGAAPPGGYVPAAGYPQYNPPPQYPPPAQYGAPAPPYPPQAPLAGVPQDAAPYAYPAQATPYGYSQPAAPIAQAAPMASVPQAAPLAAAPAQPEPDAAFGLPTSGVRRRTVRRPTPAVFMLGGFLGVVILGGLALLALNRRNDPHQRDHTTVADNNSHEHVKTHPPSLKPPAKSESLDPPEKTEAKPKNSPEKTRPPEKSPLPEKSPPEKSKEDPKTPPKTKEKEPPKTDPRAAYVAAALMSARFHLSERDLEKAKEMIAGAKKHSPGGALDGEIARVESLAHYVGEFWLAVRNHCKKLSGGDALTIEGITIAFVEGGSDYVIFRRAGRNERHVFLKPPTAGGMKTGLAIGLARLFLAKNDPVSDVILGAFQTVNPTSDRAEARGHLESARDKGSEEIKQLVSALLPELSVKIPEEAPNLPAPGEAPMTPVARGGKPAPPAGATLAEAQAAMRARFKQQLAAAVFEADKAALAPRLLQAASPDDMDALFRYALLLEARDMAAAGRKPKLALEAVAAIDKHYQVDLLALKIETLTSAQKSAEDDAGANKEVAQVALALAPETALEGKLPQAKRLAAIAEQAARKAKDANLLKDAVAAKKEIDAQKS